MQLARRLLRVPCAIALATSIAALFAIAGPGATFAASPSLPLVIATGDAAGTAPLPEVAVVSSTPQGLTLEFALPALAVDEVTARDGRIYQIVAIPGGGSKGERGQPEIPVYTRFVAIPATSDVRITQTTVLEEEELSGYRLSPFQDEQIRPGNSSMPVSFDYDPDAYARDDFGPAATTAPAQITSGPAIMRDLRLVPISFEPVRFNPARGVLKVARRVRVEVSFEGTNMENALPSAGTTGIQAPIAPSFERIYQSLVVNYEGAGVVPGVSRDGQPHVGVAAGTWVAICTSQEVVTHLQPLTDWHKRRGIPVRVALTSETGSSKESIKSWLQTAYNTWPVKPEFVCLVGDGEGSYAIQPWPENLSGYGGAGDHPYSQLNGTDILADVHVGRISISSLNELDTVVAKSVNYESAPYTQDTSWFTRGCVVGDPNSSGISTVQVMQWAKTRMRQIGYTQVDTVFSGNFVQQMTTALSRGDTVFGYRGYWGMSGWGVANTNSLTNGWKLPFCVTVTCDTGTFYSGTSNTEGFLRAGSATSPKGGIGAIGTATIGTHTGYNNCFTYGVLYGVLYEGDFDMGAAHTRGKYEMYLNYQARDPNHVTIWSYWNNLMGDPAVECFTGVPEPIAVQAPASLPIGTNVTTINVTENGAAPSVGALVCLSKGAETYVTALTDAAGNAELPLTLGTTGPMLVTVTKHNRMPYLGQINITNAPVVSYQASTIDDDTMGASLGNSDGLVNPAETIELGIQVRNFGTVQAGGVGATLTSNDPYVTIVQGTSTYGDIPASQSAWGAEKYVFTIHPDCPVRHTIHFGLDVTSGSDQWHSILDVATTSADLLPGGFTYYNAGSNGVLDPGETVQVSLKIHNSGDENATAVSAILTPLSPFVYPTDSYGAWGDIPIGATIENTADKFSVHADAQVPNGYLAHFRLVKSYSNGLTDTSNVSILVGIPTTVDPTGPDHYGYYAFDNTDTRYADVPVYNWLELDPSHGGSGTQLTLNDMGQYQDASVVIDIPFTFKYYGQDYTRTTVCSNGWMAMGSTYLTEYRNWTIPSAGGPQAMIAPFWDDLNLSSGGKVLTRYDAADHRFIVEWSNVRNDPGAVQTFEVILYDPAFVPTQTGDGVIAFQYQTVNNTDPENFATVGIENVEHTDGLLYSFSSLYTTGSTPLTANRAIRFTTTLPNLSAIPDRQTAQSVFMLGQNMPNPWRGTTSIHFSIPQAQSATLAIYDVQGRTVRVLKNGAQPAGPQTVSWDGRTDRGLLSPAGVYFYRLDAGNRSETRKLIRVE
jgi:hypothetical protein